MTKTTRTSMRIALTGLIIASGFAAQASGGDGEEKSQGKMRHERPSFSALDTDSNGALSKDELAARGRARFDAGDVDGDGMLSKDEMLKDGRKRAERRAGKMIKRHDANGDGMISFEEMKSGKHEDRLAKMFERIDADGNGTLSEEEFAKLEKLGRGNGKRKHKKSDD